MQTQHTFTGITDRRSFYDLARFDANAYGEHDVPTEILARWWHAFPPGIRVAYDQTGAIVGAMSGWPLTREAYLAITEGRMDEGDLTPASFDLSPGERPYWYISGLATAETVRSSARFLFAFLMDGLTALGAESRCATPDICAVAVSREGERMLRRFGFQRLSETGHGVVFEKRSFRDARVTIPADKLRVA